LKLYLEVISFSTSTEQQLLQGKEWLLKDDYGTTQLILSLAIKNMSITFHSLVMVKQSHNTPVEAQGGEV
jgi:hypothetical protein